MRKLTCTGFAILLLVTGLAAAVFGQEPNPPWNPPPYQMLRFNENWSGLAHHDPTLTGDWFDRIKYIPLSDDGEVWISFGGHARLRIEDWSNFNFNESNDDTFLLSRLVMHGDLHLGEHLRIFAEGLSAHVTDRDLPGGKRTLDVDEAEISQLFVDLKLPLSQDVTLTLRPGRQMFLFGKQRLVSPLPWANAMRQWDGVSAIIRGAGWSVHTFYSQFAPVRKYDLNRADPQTEFWGAYATGKLPGLGTDAGLDLYFLGLNRGDDVTFNGTTGEEDRYTVGGRVWGKLAGSFDYDMEGAYQFGEVGSGDISAWMFATQVGYTFAGCPSSPRVYVGLDYASGDRSPGGDVQTFNQLFPLGHAYLGFIDVIGRQNIIDLSAGVAVKPLKDTTVTLSVHFLRRAEDADALYNAGGAVVRGAGGSSRKEIGTELDLTIEHQFNRHLKGLLGYSHLFAGDFIEQTATTTSLDEDIDFLYGELTFTF